MGYKKPTRSLTIHYVTSWTHQLYKDNNTRVEAKQFHHPRPPTPTYSHSYRCYEDVSLCDQLGDSHCMYMHSDSIHLHIHCFNKYLQQTRDWSNTDISTALKYLGVLFHRGPYRYSLDSDPVQVFLVLFFVNTMSIHNTTSPCLILNRWCGRTNTRQCIPTTIEASHLV